LSYFFCVHLFLKFLLGLSNPADRPYVDSGGR